MTRRKLEIRRLRTTEDSSRQGARGKDWILDGSTRIWNLRFIWKNRTRAVGESYRKMWIFRENAPTGEKRVKDGALINGRMRNSIRCGERRGTTTIRARQRNLQQK